MLDNINEYNLLLIICVIFGQVVVPLAYSKFKTANFTSRNTLRINFYTGIYEKKIEMHSTSRSKYDVNSNSWNFFYKVSIVNVRFYN